MLKKWFVNNQEVLKSGHFWSSWISSLLLLAATLGVNYYSGQYATERASSPVTDIILSNVRVYDVDLIFVYGAIAFWVVVTILLLLDLRLGPFVVKSISLFLLIRSFFTSLTHIAPFPERLTTAENTFILNKVTFGGDLFFSGHTGLPFLLALIFWDNKHLRYGCLGVSVMMAASALLGHYHYSIDVFAAYFITYAIAHIAWRAFPSDPTLACYLPFVAEIFAIYLPG